MMLLDNSVILAWSQRHVQRSQVQRWKTSGKCQMTIVGLGIPAVLILSLA